MLDSLEEHLLVPGVGDLLHADDLLLVEDFDRVKAEVVFAADCQVYLGQRKWNEMGCIKFSDK